MANHILPATLATAITITSVPAVAQSPQASEDPPRATSDEPVVLAVEEVKVTALKRRDALNTLPVSVSVVDGDAFVTSSIDTGAALTRETPNFAFAGFGQPGNDFVNIRGVGILGQPANSLDNTVGFATNGAATSALGYPGLLLDVERIEILRGPQGTLFGRNALGGLVNIVTRPADGRRDVGITLEGGADGYQLAEAVAGGWLSENRLAGRLAVRHHQQDGDIKNPVINADEGGLKAAAARGTLSYQIAPHIHADLVLSHDRNEQESSFLLLQEHPEFPISGADQMPYNDRRRSEGTLEVQAEYDAFSLTSLSNVQHIAQEGDIDLAGDILFETAFGFIPEQGADIILSDQNERLVSQEFRIQSHDEATLRWLAGVNFFRTHFTLDRNSSSSFSPYSSGLWDVAIDSEVWSVFGDLGKDLSERWSLSGGLRLAQDEQDFSVRYTGKGFPGSVEAFQQDERRTDSYTTGHLTLGANWNAATYSYFRVARGYASGGYDKGAFNAAVGEETVAFAPSKSWSYELGLKMQLLQGRATINGSVFFNDVDNGQLLAANTETQPTTFEFINQDYDTYGLELETRWLPSRALELSLALGYTETELRDVTEAAAVGVKSGNRVPGAPELTAAFNAHVQLAPRWRASLQFQHVGDRAADAQNTDLLAAYDMINARLTWGQERFKMYAFVNNWQDERPEYFSSTYSDTAHALSIGPGRVLGLGLRGQL